MFKMCIHVCLKAAAYNSIRQHPKTSNNIGRRSTTVKFAAWSRLRCLGCDLTADIYIYICIKRFFWKLKKTKKTTTKKTHSESWMSWWKGGGDLFAAPPVRMIIKINKHCRAIKNKIKKMPWSIFSAAAFKQKLQYFFLLEKTCFFFFSFSGLAETSGGSFHKAARGLSGRS